MNSFGRSLALMLVGWCVAFLPADRASWTAAMKAEVDVIEDGSATLSFAFGCIWAFIKDRLFPWIPIYILAYAFASSGHGMTAASGDARFFQALAIEGIVIWTTLLLGAAFMLRVETLTTTKLM